MIPFIQLDDKKSAMPLYRQIYETVRRAILRGEFAAGVRLPATRLLADQSTSHVRLLSSNSNDRCHPWFKWRADFNQSDTHHAEPEATDQFSDHLVASGSTQQQPSRLTQRSVTSERLVVANRIGPVHRMLLASAWHR